MAKQKKWSERQIKSIRARLKEYIQKTQVPSIAEFAVQEGVPRGRLYEWDEMADTLDLLRAKRESYLEKQLLDPQTKNSTGAIFALKQLGWSDKQEVNQTGQVTHRHVVELPKQDTVEQWQSRREREIQGNAQGEIENK